MFCGKVYSRTSEKRTDVYIAQDGDSTLAGCVLIKNTEEEKKICTLFVNPKFRRQALGKQLMEQTLKELGEHPLKNFEGNKKICMKLLTGTFWQGKMMAYIQQVK